MFAWTLFLKLQSFTIILLSILSCNIFLLQCKQIRCQLYFISKLLIRLSCHLILPLDDEICLKSVISKSEYHLM
jgi:hypothetical protein